MKPVTPHIARGLALPVLLMLTACATTTSEQAEYVRQDRLNRFLDHYQSMRAHCRAQGLALAVQHNMPERCSGKTRRINGGFCPPQPGDRILGCMGRYEGL